MTAEVLVMNTSAVAMAADTAVSISYGGGTKTYTRARKLLPLHESQPLAVMVSDAPDHLGMPWEVIVGEFRRKKPEPPAKLDGYVETFFQFVDEKATQWIYPAHEISLLRTVLDREARLLQELWDKRLKEPNPPRTGQEMAAAAAEASREFAAGGRQRQLQADQWADHEAQELKRLDANIEARFAAEATGLWDNLQAAVRTELVALARDRMMHIAEDERGSSLLVFAGYGSDELFAQAQTWRGSGRLASTTRRVRRLKLSITPRFPAVIVPVAQEGVVNSFLQGLHPDVDQLVVGLLQGLAGELGDPGLVTGAKRAFDDEISRRGDEVTRAVEFLPPGDLATVAGDLIRMTALRNRVTMTADTVAEPIDVVLLSRSDGLRWIAPPGGLRTAADER